MMEHKNPFPKFLKIASFFPDTSIICKWEVLSIALLLISLVTWGHVEGDYQTRATGDWNDYNTWQVSSGGSWSDCSEFDYPGVAAGALTVYITGGSTVSVIADVPNSIGAIVFNGASETNIVQFSGAYALDITGTITINPPTSNFNDNGLYVNSGFVTCTSLTSINSDNPNMDCKVAISAGRILTVNGDITMGVIANRNDITFTGAGTLTVTGNLTTGQLTCVDNSTINIGGALISTAFTISTSTINFNRAAQNIPFYTYYNLSCSGSGTKTLPNANVTVNGSLDIFAFFYD